MPNDQMNNIPVQPGKKRNHQGELNPHYQHPHSDKAKAAISSRQKARYEMLRQIVDKKTVSEERVREIVKETIDEYLTKHAIPVENNNKKIDIRL